MLKKILKKITKKSPLLEKSAINFLNPVSSKFGYDRGTPIDRYYIEKFLKQNSQYIKGQVLEIQESYYSYKFGENQVDAFEILSPCKETPAVTIVGNLEDPASLPENQMDCFICTQSFNFIYNVHDAVKGSYRLLKPGGILLATVAGLCQISRYDMERWGDYWRFTTLSVERLFGDVFGEENVVVAAYGNVMAATAILYGLAAEELKSNELDYPDQDYQVLITIRAVKPQ